MLCIDADERVSPELAAAVAALFAAGAPPAGALRGRAPQSLSRPLARARRRLSRLERAPVRPPARALERRSGARARGGRRPGRALAGDLLHASAESIDAYIAKQNRYTTLQAEALHARGERAGALRVALSPAARFLRFYVMKRGFLDGVPGFAHIAIGAFASFLKYVKLRALAARPRAPGE